MGNARKDSPALGGESKGNGFRGRSLEERRGVTSSTFRKIKVSESRGKESLEG